MVTAAGTAHANRLPILILAGDTFTNRLSDPVLQQVEHFGDPTATVNDAFKAVSRYWDRITHPAQIIASMPQAIATMLDPGDCGPAFIALPQDTQELAFDYPSAFFEEKVWTIPRPRADRDRVAEAASLLESATKPLIISGGGVRYSGAEEAVAAFAAERGIPVVETIAGKGALTHYDPVHCGPIGVVGSTSANALAAAADVILAIGTPPAGLHHRVVDGVRARTRGSSRSTPRAGMRRSTGRLRWWATPSKRFESSTPPSAPGRWTVPI